MDLQTMLVNLMKFGNEVLVPLLLALAAVAFFWQIFKLFIMEGGNEEKHAQAREYATWAIAAFVFILSLWGIVNLLTASLGLGGGGPGRSDYMCESGANCPPSSQGNNNTDFGDLNNQLPPNEEDDFFINQPFTDMPDE